MLTPNPLLKENGITLEAICVKCTLRKKVAASLGIKTDIEGGIPFVMSQEDFDHVKEYLIVNQVEGWWHYVTHEEYCEIKGEYYFWVNIFVTRKKSRK